MKINFKGTAIFAGIAVLGLYLWFIFGYPQFKFINLKVDKKAAIEKAETYLKSRGVDTGRYSKVAVFDTDSWADRYLQKTVGLKGEEEFISKHDYELFGWNVRFFRELQKEEYAVAISPKSGEVISFVHLIDDIEARRTPEKESARKKAEEFLNKTFGFSLDGFDFHREELLRYDKRVDYSFSWEKKGVYIPWKDTEGGAKLIIGATVSGDEIRSFYKCSLDIPEKFTRYIENQMVMGEYLSNFSTFSFIILFCWSIYIMVRRRYDVVVRICKKWYVYLFVFLLAVHVLGLLNNLDNLFFSYSTSTRLNSYIGIYVFKFIINLIFICVAFIIPGISGESLRNEYFPNRPLSSFLYYLRSSFMTRGMARGMAFGYLLFFIFLGMQSAMFYFGQKYCGVWKEWITLSHLSSAYIPFLNAFVVGITASLNEEVLFRLFGIGWAKKYLRNTVLAVLVSSLIWGFGHTTYAVFPSWFRGIEVSIMGLLYGFIFLRYGIIPLVVAHYLFDVFWGVSAYMLGQSTLYLFMGALFFMLLPLIIAGVFFVMNRPQEEREITLALSSEQRYNLQILKVYISAKKKEGLPVEILKQELLRNNWDPALVDIAIEEIFR